MAKFNETYLDLSHQHVFDLTQTSFTGFENISILLVNNNLIKLLRGDTFELVPGLKELNASHNQIYWIHSATFSRLNLLTMLDLSYNDLETIKSSILINIHAIQILDIRHNPWTCDCKLESFLRWMSINDSVVAIKAGECNSKSVFIYHEEKGYSYPYSPELELSYKQDIEEGRVNIYNFSRLPMDTTEILDYCLKAHHQKPNNLPMWNYTYYYTIGIGTLTAIVFLLLCVYLILKIIKLTKQKSLSKTQNLSDRQLSTDIYGNPIPPGTYLKIEPFALPDYTAKFEYNKLESINAATSDFKGNGTGTSMAKESDENYTNEKKELSNQYDKLLRQRVLVNLRQLYEPQPVDEAYLQILKRMAAEQPGTRTSVLLPISGQQILTDASTGAGKRLSSITGRTDTLNLEDQKKVEEYEYTDGKVAATSYEKFPQEILSSIPGTTAALTKSIESPKVSLVLPKPASIGTIGKDETQQNILNVAAPLQTQLPLNTTGEEDSEGSTESSEETSK